MVTLPELHLAPACQLLDKLLIRHVTILLTYSLASATSTEPILHQLAVHGATTFHEVSVPWTRIRLLGSCKNVGFSNWNLFQCSRNKGRLEVVLRHCPNAFNVLRQLDDLATLEGSVLAILDNIGVSPVHLVPLAR